MIPDGVKSICGKAFEECSGITNVSIPDSVAYIGWGAFRNCTGLESLTVPAGITQIESEAFENVSKVIYDGSADNYEDWGNTKVEKSDGTVLL